MRVRYYVILENNNHEHHEFHSIESMQYFFIHFAKKPVGEIYLVEFPWLKIVYDTDKGEVTLTNTQIQPGITYRFSADAFQSNLNPIHEAIRCWAKVELLAQLYLIPDDELRRIISRRHEVDPVTGRMTSNTKEHEVNETFYKLQVYILPQVTGMKALMSFFSGWEKVMREQTNLQRAIYEALDNYSVFDKGLDVIKAGRDVEAIMKMIQQSMLTYQRK